MKYVKLFQLGVNVFALKNIVGEMINFYIKYREKLNFKNKIFNLEPQPPQNTPNCCIISFNFLN